MKKKTKEDALLRLSRMSGQVAGLTKMVEDDRYCVDILTQVAACRGALEQVGMIVLSAHIEECVYGDTGSQPDPDTHSEERIEEVRLALGRFLK